MAQATFSVTTSRSGTPNVWKRIQGKIAKGFNFGDFKEMALMQRLPDGAIPWSAKSVEFPLDITEDANVASIPEGGYFARSSSPDMQLATVDVIELNARFSASWLAKFTDKGQANQHKKQLAYQAAKKVEAINLEKAIQFHGSSSGILAQTDTDLAGTTDTLTLKNAFAAANFDNAKYLARLFPVGGYVAALDSGGALVDANAIGQVTARSESSGTIDITWIGSVSSYTTNDINIVRAANVENTTVAGGTSYNKAMVGLRDICTATSLHSVSGSSYPNWTAAGSDTSGGNLTHTKYLKAKQEIENDGGKMANTFLVAQGVYRQYLKDERAGLRYTDGTTVSLDGDVAAKGVQIIDSKMVPNGAAYLFDRSQLALWEILPQEDGSGISWNDGIQRQDEAAMTFPMSWVGNTICYNRKAFYYFEQLTEA
ncbi:hypothetical protein [Caudoviricetes sp.]|nr:hypothetical protein [Caudoviricetes sp.]